MRPLSHPGTGRRSRSISLARGAAGAVTLVAALAVLNGCGGALVNEYYLLPTPRQTFIQDDFDWWDDGLWSFDVEEGYPYGLDVQGGHFIAAEARQFARTQDPVPTNIEIRTEWEVWSPDATPIGDNGDTFDFRVMLDTSQSGGYVPAGIRVELKLFEGGVDDRLTITDDASGSTATAANPTVGSTGGTLKATFRRDASPPTVAAQVYDRSGVLLLETELTLAEQWDRDAHLMLQASGYYTGVGTEARALDSVHGLSVEGL